MRQNDDNLGLRHLVAKIVEKSLKKNRKTTRKSSKLWRISPGFPLAQVLSLPCQVINFSAFFCCNSFTILWDIFCCTKEDQSILKKWFFFAPKEKEKMIDEGNKVVELSKLLKWSHRSFISLRDFKKFFPEGQLRFFFFFGLVKKESSWDFLALNNSKRSIKRESEGTWSVAMVGILHRGEVESWLDTEPHSRPLPFGDHWSKVFPIWDIKDLSALGWTFFPLVKTNTQNAQWGKISIFWQKQKNQMLLVLRAKTVRIFSYYWNQNFVEFWWKGSWKESVEEKVNFLEFLVVPVKLLIWFTIPWKYPTLVNRISTLLSDGWLQL